MSKLKELERKKDSIKMQMAQIRKQLEPLQALSEQVRLLDLDLRITLDQIRQESEAAERAKRAKLPKSHVEWVRCI